jgi:hypothetical protein
LTALDPAQRLVCTEIFNWMDQYRQSIVNMEAFEIRELPYWIKAQNLEKRNLQVSRPSNQLPFYVEPKASQTPLPPYEEVRNYELPVRSAPIEQPIRIPETYNLPQPVEVVRSYPQRIPVYQPEAVVFSQEPPLFSQ